MVFPFKLVSETPHEINFNKLWWNFRKIAIPGWDVQAEESNLGILFYSMESAVHEAMVIN